MRHLTFAAIAALIASLITGSLHFYGAHDIQGLFAIVAGYPGFLASGIDRPVHESLFTAVNGLFYFGVIEGSFALKRKFFVTTKSDSQAHL
jgi:hypothetical protein